MTKTGDLTATETAAVIRKELRQQFPGVKFSVRRDYFAGGSSVDIRWTDGPRETSVRSITDVYDRVRRDEYSGEILLGGNMYVQTQREYTEQAKEWARDLVERSFVKGNFQSAYERDTTEWRLLQCTAFDEGEPSWCEDWNHTGPSHYER